jgi:putative NADH-flavin reductase
VKILVLGTRGIGLQVIKQGLSLGHQVCALSRRPGALLIADDNFTLVAGDAENAPDIEKASHGMDVIVSAIGAPPSKKEISIFSVSAGHIISAVKKNSVKLFIMVSGIGAGDSRGHGGFIYEKLIFPSLLSGIYADKNRAESLVFQSDINWIIVRPGFLTDGKLTEKYRILTELAGVKCGKISRADAAHFILTQAASRTYVKQTPLITY